MSIDIERICNTFNEVSKDISLRTSKSQFTGLGIREETITDILINDIQLSLNKYFLTRKFTNKEEGSITGSDWLWCIGEQNSWITFSVQAKITKNKTGRVNYLHYRAGEQYDLLINFCKKFKFIPKYSIYSRIDPGLNLFSNKIHNLANIPINRWSFSSISPKYIKHLKTPDERHITKVLNYSIPWSYIFCLKDSRKSNFADMIAEKLESVYWIFENEYRREHKLQPRKQYKNIIWENPQPSRMVTRYIPIPVLYLLCKDQFDHKVPISNVSILVKGNARKALDFELKRIKKTKHWSFFPRTFENYIENDKNPIRYLE